MGGVYFNFAKLKPSISRSSSSWEVSSEPASSWTCVSSCTLYSVDFICNSTP